MSSCGSSSLFCCETGIRTRPSGLCTFASIPSLLFTFREQPQHHTLSFSFRKPLKLVMSQPLILNSATVEEPEDSSLFDYHRIDEKLLQSIVNDALVWSALNCLLVGDRSVQRSGTVPGVGLVHLPLSLLPTPLPQSYWKQACELAPIFNELVDREIRMGIMRSDYMIDEKTKSLLQIEINTISSSYAAFGSLMTGLHKSLLSDYGKHLGLDSQRVPSNNAGDQSAEALAKAWTEYNNPRAVVLVVVQEWRARLLMEQSSAIKCPSISYHLVGTKKIQQELAKPGVLERFVENKDHIAKLRACFAGLWSLEDSDIVKKAIENPELFVLKPQREGGGNNIYGDALRETLLKLQESGSREDAAYILMQRIFPASCPAILVRNGNWDKGHTITEVGIFSTYLRNKDKVIINNESGYTLRTKMSSSNEGGVAAGFGVLDTVYLT
ncbi:hypothetical protein Fmac_007012 [Flemingia macrophylla]|uniref:Glutathione synthetase n=1 Tax=Flemingia macrophylla TaxID=520843 RepID=A0ABD1NC86_9FABA